LTQSSHIAFLLLLKGVCRSLGRESLAAHANAFFLTYVSMTALYFLIYGAMIALFGLAALGVGTGAGPNLGAAGSAAGLGVILGLFVCLLPIVVLGLFIWFLILLFQVRAEVDAYVRRRA
jgi:hypothetical protein